MPRVLSTLSERRSSGWQPQDAGWISATYDPVGISTGTIIPATAVGGRLWVPRGALISNIICSVVTAGATLTSGQNGAAIYSPAGALLGRTTDQSASGFASAGAKAMPLVTPFTTTVDGLYDIVLWSNGTTKVTLARSINNVIFNLNAMRAFTVANVTTTPPATLGTKTALSTPFFFALS